MTINEITGLISALKGRLAMCQSSDPSRAQAIAKEIDVLLALRTSLEHKRDEET